MMGFEFRAIRKESHLNKPFCYPKSGYHTSHLEKYMEHFDQSSQPEESRENNELALIAAVCLALNSPDPHRRSPAFAAQLAFADTCGDAETVLQWILRFLEMSGREYRVGWDVYASEWTTSKDISICGMTIAKDCVYWMQRHWDFTFHQGDGRYEYDRHNTCGSDTDTKQDIADFEATGFILPGDGEIVRRTWVCPVGGKTRMLDIWEAPFSGKYYYAIREVGSKELLARCWYPYHPWELRLLVETELIPTAASEPFIVKARKARNQGDRNAVTPEI